MKAASQRLMRRIVQCVLLLLLLSGLLAGAAETLRMPDRDALIPAFCERVIDGDTAWFRVVEGGVEVSHKVRFLGIDTPETVHPDLPVQAGGEAASAYVRALLEEQPVWLEYDQQRLDRYGRQLCFVWLADGRLLNLDLVLQGYASVLFIAPNARYRAVFDAAQEMARHEGLGIWAEAVPLP